MIQGQLWERREAKQAALRLEEGLVGAEVSPTAESTACESLPMEAEDNREASSRRRVIDTMQSILERVRLQALYEMGSAGELDQTLARALMAKFARVQLVIEQDLTMSLIAL